MRIENLTIDEVRSKVALILLAIKPQEEQKFNLGFIIDPIQGLIKINIEAKNV